MPRLIKKGSTDVTDYVVIQDSTSGAPETGVTITDLDLQYVRNGAAPSAKVDATALAAIDSAHSDNTMFEVDGTDQPGLYRVDWPDAMFATGVSTVVGTVSGTGFHPAHKEYQLVNFDPEDAVRLGLTALPNAAADDAGGLPISDAGGLDLDTKLANTNEITAARMSELDAGTAGKMANQVDIIQTDTTTDIPALIATAQADLDVLTGADGATLATLQGNYAPAKAGNQMDLIDAPNATAITAIQTGLMLNTEDGSSFSAIPWNAAWDAEVQSEVADALGVFFTDSATLVSAVWSEASALTLDFGTLLERAYQLLNNEMNVTDADGTAALRNIADDADIASGSITDNDTTTSRSGWVWA